MSRSGAELALLMLAGFRTLADEATATLAERGYPDVRPSHDFALRAILAGAESASDLARAMAVTKQAAAKTIAVLEERGYVTREPDETDARRIRVRVTDSATAMLAEGERVFDELRTRWEQQVGAAALGATTDALRALVGERAIRLDAPGWVASDVND